MSDDQSHVGSGDKQPGPNLYAALLWMGLPVAGILAWQVNLDGEIYASAFTLDLVAAVVAFGVWCVIVTIFREAWHHRPAGLSLPFGLGGVTPQKDAGGVDPAQAQHEAITSQAKAVEAVGEALTNQAATNAELLQAERDRADGEKARAEALEAERDALLDQQAAEQVDAAAAPKPITPPDGRQQEVRVRTANPAHEDRPPG